MKKEAGWEGKLKIAEEFFLSGKLELSLILHTLLVSLLLARPKVNTGYGADSNVVQLPLQILHVVKPMNGFYWFNY